VVGAVGVVGGTLLAGCGDDTGRRVVAVVVGLDAFGDTVPLLERALVAAGVEGGVELVEIDLGLGPRDVVTPEALAAGVEELRRLAPDVVVTLTTPVTEAVLAADSELPVVFGAVNDPAGVGLVEDVAAPGDRRTGVATLTGAASLDVVVRATGARRVGMPVAPASGVARSAADQVRGAAAALGVTLVELPVVPASLDVAALRALLGDVDAVVLRPAPFVVQVREAVAAEAVAAGVPFGLSLGWLRPLDGVVVAVAPDLADLADGLARRTVAVLEGVLAGEIPVEPVEVLVSVDLDVAERVGVAPPPLLLTEADAVFGADVAPDGAGGVRP
jgi:putative ABC transport system substrate-binding protein